MSTVYSRVRTKQNAEYARSSSVRYDWIGDKWVASPPARGTNRQVGSTVETMRDNPGPASKDGRYPERSCHHSKDIQKMYFFPSTKVFDYMTYYASNELYGLNWRTVSHLGTFPGSESRPDLLADLLEGLDPSQTSLQGLPFIGEFSQTCRMIRRPWEFLSSLPKGARTSTLGGHLRKLGLGPASGAWLQHRYGWKPLMGDLSAIAATLGSFGSDYERYTKGEPWQKARLSKTYYAGAITHSSVTYSLSTSLSKQAKVTTQYRLRAAEGTARAMTRPAFLAQRLGLTPRHLASAVWELIPYSFVVDWFLPVGEMLSSVSRVEGAFDLRNTSYHDTWRRETTRSDWLSPGITAHGVSNAPTRASAASFTRVTEDYWRNDADHGPSGDLSLGSMTTTRYISALALIAQRLMQPIK